MARKRPKTRKRMLIVVTAIVVMMVILAVLLFADFDGDGLSNINEARAGTSVTNSDTDGDGLSDGLEVNVYHTNPLVADTDNDGLLDGLEVNTYKTNPLVADSDYDNLSDGQEVTTYKTNPLSTDTDNDNLNDGLEVSGWSIMVNGVIQQVTSNPSSADSDNDNLSDWDEYHTHHTSPLRIDSDGDNLTDWSEVNTYKTDPLSTDTDNDGLSDGREVYETMTNALSPDTDKDGIWDGYEVENMAQYGANPRRRDIFVEIDRMDTNTRWLNETEKSGVINAFKNAPILNPDGTWGVDLHLFESTIVPSMDNMAAYYPNGVLGAMSYYKNSYMNYPREGFFYCLLAKTGSVGWGGLNFGPEFVLDINPEITELYGHNFMHELGHSLGLTHSIFDGIDSKIYDMSSYPSIMNYNVLADFYGYSSGGAFDDWGYLEEHGFKLHEYFWGY